MRWKQARERAGITQAELARRVDLPGVDKPYISKMESGLLAPPPKTFYKILEALDCTAEDICTPMDLDYGFAKAKPKRAVATREKPAYTKATVRLPKEAASGLPEKCKALGYRSLNDYLARCVERLAQDYEKQKEEKDDVLQDM